MIKVLKPGLKSPEYAVYSMIRAIEQVTTNKNMGDFAGSTSNMNRHTDLVGCY